MIHVKFSKPFLKFSLILASVTASNALVQSSNISTSGLLISARAMEILCFCPPEKLIPSCPILVSYFSGNLSINSLASAISQTFFYFF